MIMAQFVEMDCWYGEAWILFNKIVGLKQNVINIKLDNDICINQTREQSLVSVYSSLETRAFSGKLVLIVWNPLIVEIAF